MRMTATAEHDESPPLAVSPTPGQECRAKNQKGYMEEDEPEPLPLDLGLPGPLKLGT